MAGPQRFRAGDEYDTEAYHARWFTDGGSLDDVVASIYVAYWKPGRDRREVWRRRLDRFWRLPDSDQNYVRAALTAEIVRRRERLRHVPVPLASGNMPHARDARVDGVRFRRDGVTEQALKALVRQPRHKHHHFDLALADLNAANDRVPIRKVALEEAKNRALVGGEADREKAEKQVAQATLDLALAERAVLVCASKLQSKIDPKTGKPRPGPPGRAPRGMSGPIDQLEGEYAARERLADVQAFMATGDLLPELGTKHLRWERLVFPYYVDCIAHERLRFEAMPDAVVKDLDDHVLAFSLYIYREASKRGIPVVTAATGRIVKVEHALWGDRLNDDDFDDIAEFVMHAAKRLHLKVDWRGMIEAQAFVVHKPTTKDIDYGHIVRQLRRRNWRSFSATDEDPFEEMTPGSEWATTSTPEFQARMDAERAQLAIEEEAYQRFLETGQPQLINGKPIDEARPWIDPMPRLEESGLPWALVRLFKKVAHLSKVPSARLQARSLSEAWYTLPSSYVVSPDLIAGELYEAIRAGDLDQVVWWHENLLPRISDDIVRRAITITEQMLGAE